MNAGAEGIWGPLTLVLDGLPRRVRLRRAGGLTLARPPLLSPFVVVLPGTAAWPGGVPLPLTLEFVVPSGRRPFWLPRLLAGLGLP